jgi:F-type H+-transporting ATPase subunit b
VLILLVLEALIFQPDQQPNGSDNPTTRGITARSRTHGNPPGDAVLPVQVLVHRPLTAVLAERRNRTEGALEKARADIASAEARTADYEQRLREARLKIFKNLEARRQQALQARTEAAAQARARAQEQVKAARADIEQYKQEALTNLQAEAGRLASEIVRTVLRPVQAASPVGGQ